MTTSYENDIVAWANEQARLIRAGQFDQLDLVNIAQEIEDVGKSEKRELASRMAVLLTHLFRWQYLPSRQSNSWQRTIKEQRRSIQLHLDDVPSLRNSLTNSKWLSGVYSDAVAKAIGETGVDTFPDALPWSIHDVLTEGWFPSEP
jgi:Domain of unknown function DUF29